ncbi:MAG: hypothetical protein Q7T82_07500 [Armatimonadota bacterium]|nr:hypothetical protein [Armatimonadota bacterium]
MIVLLYLGALVIIVPLYYLWDWWSEGTISGSEAVGAAAVLLVILGQIAAFPDPSLRVALFVLLVASAILMPFFATAVEKVADSRFKSDRVATFRSAIARDRMNMAARVQLAETLYAMGRLDEAIAELETAFESSKLSFRESQILAEWKEERRIRDTRNVFCPSCGKENEHGSAACTGCGHPLARGFAADWARSGGPAAALKAWAIAIGCVAVVLFAFALFPSARTPNPLIVAGVGLAAWAVFYIWSRRRRNPKTLKP